MNIVLQFHRESRISEIGAKITFFDHKASTSISLNGVLPTVVSYLAFLSGISRTAGPGYFGESQNTERAVGCRVARVFTASILMLAT